jgi:hypothetical protein
MQGAPGDTHDATDTSQQRFREQDQDRFSARDDTTLQFSGRMNVSDEEAGNDPYNRTGRFRRMIR